MHKTAPKNSRAQRAKVLHNDMMLKMVLPLDLVVVPCPLELTQAADVSTGSLRVESQNHTKRQHSPSAKRQCSYLVIDGQMPSHSTSVLLACLQKF